MNKTYAQASVEIEVPFHDIDMMEIAWHGHYAKYLEIARSALLQTFDYDVPQMRESEYAWPVIELHIRYAHPLRFQQKIRVDAALHEFENRMKIGYEIIDSLSGKRLTKAHTIQVAYCMKRREMRLASPQILLDKIGL